MPDIDHARLKPQTNYSYGCRCDDCTQAWSAYLKTRGAEQRALIEEAKDRPCADCGQQFPPPAMDFDHVRGEKEIKLAHAHRLSIERVRDEIAKCEVVCAVCHRLRTHARNQHGNGLKRDKTEWT